MIPANENAIRAACRRCTEEIQQPEPPAGDGWFVGSIHDTEDGAVCIWLRQAGGAA